MKRIALVASAALALTLAAAPHAEAAGMQTIGGVNTDVDFAPAPSNGGGRAGAAAPGGRAHTR